METKQKPPKIYTVPAVEVYLGDLKKPIVETTSETILWAVQRLQQAGKKTPMIFEKKEEIIALFDDAILVARKDGDANYVEIVPIEDITLSPEAPKVEFSFAELKKMAKKAGTKIYETRNMYWTISEAGILNFARKNFDIDVETIKVNKITLPPEAPQAEMGIGELRELAFRKSLPIWETPDEYIVLAQFVCISPKKRKDEVKRFE